MRREKKSKWKFLFAMYRTICYRIDTDQGWCELNLINFKSRHPTLPQKLSAFLMKRNESLIVCLYTTLLSTAVYRSRFCQSCNAVCVFLFLCFTLGCLSMSCDCCPCAWLVSVSVLVHHNVAGQEKTIVQ